ncbi:MAG TPA: hypothetical protein VHL08_00980 [Dongiaceae bacterium]|jgi:hypothetical protein|nr:hypothetical protein [Dongiaceae bacterium]
MVFFLDLGHAGGLDDREIGGIRRGRPGANEKDAIQIADSSMIGDYRIAEFRDIPLIQA